MPVALDPDELYRYVISTDRSKPIDKQPTLLFHFPTCRQTRQIANLFDKSDSATDIDESIKLSCDALRVILAGWENFVKNGKPVSYDPNEVDDILSDNDFVELRSRLLKDMSFDELAKKKRVLFPQSSSENSAPAVTANA